MFGRRCSIIGVVHLLPLPGSDAWGGNIKELLELAVEDALAYKKGGVDALILENMHDVPYLRGRVEPETTAAMARIAGTVKQETGLQLGIQLLAGANLDSIAAAVAAEADFIRVEGFVYAHIGDEGLHQSTAAELLRKKAALKSEIKIFADIKKKHSAHAITQDVSIAETAQAAEFFKADGVIVTGSATGKPASIADIKSVKSAVKLPVLVGSGVTPENIKNYTPVSDALIVGSAMKHDGNWQNHVDQSRVEALVEAASR